ncbi:MAG: hypothetical protein NZ898_08225 [Myxococcota bacterium]|nr:hypothetical protein [Myxococcota bacterium]MDW8361388.1 hypothetical protein [Myxococcales bacterium]
MRTILKAFVSLVAIGLGAYVVFSVPLGRHTLAGHLLRIARTEPARELGHETARAAERIASQIHSTIRGGDGEPSRRPDPTSAAP